MPPPSRASRSGGGVGGRGPWASSSGAPCASGAVLVEEPRLRRRNDSPSKGAGASASPSAPVLHPTTTLHQKAAPGGPSSGSGFGGRASSSDESLSRMDLAFFFFAEAGAGAGRAGAGAAAPAALRVLAAPRRRRGASRRGAVLIQRR